ncbi:hypothetical protein F5887DRAFT_1158884 [Amanita rubescens]|nr:hypothetical protein F5887DRAFT_1158884 [Amanita rubescens]
MVRRSRTKTAEKRSYSCSDVDDSDYAEDCRPRKRTKATAKGKRRAEPEESDSLEQENTDAQVQHPKSLHNLRHVRDIREALLRWFAGVHDAREMPWRKRFNPNLSIEERNQRAYEVWVSEVMLQQTQVVTVIPYYKRWMEKFPTIDDLAISDIEQVNALWKGLGYYSRASRLLAGAQKVVKALGGRLPDNAKEMQDEVPGIGRYSAGAICSIAYGERVPVLDGNVHRLLSRLLAVHAPPKAKATLDLLWDAATGLVQSDAENLCALESGAKEDNAANSEMARTQYPGDINQALIELGSTVCRVQDPHCSACPIRSWCRAYNLTNEETGENGIADGIHDIEDLCTLCVPISGENAVTAYPMKGNRKKAREELDIVNVIEWRQSLSPEERWFLLVRRPENGLLAGLYEFPTTANVSKTISSAALLKQTNSLLSKHIDTEIQPFDARQKKTSHLSFGKTCQVENVIPAGDIVHVFSHIRKTYRVQWVILEGGQGPPQLSNAKNAASPDSTAKITMGSRWYRHDEVGGANIGSGVIKVWNLVKKKWVKSGSSEAEYSGLERRIYGAFTMLRCNMSHENLMTTNDGESRGKDHYYCILNLPRTASQNEIKENYRSLSLTFHPDKHQDAKAKEVAARTFLEIQKAYQVLSDPFLREVYDTFGEQGLTYNWDESIRSKSKEELKDIFKGVKRETLEKQWRNEIQPRGRLQCSIDASSLFEPYRGSATIDALPVRLANRMADVRVAAYSLRHSVKKRLNDKTVASFTTTVSGREKKPAISFLGTVRHQFSPRLTAEATLVRLLAPHVFRLGANYEDENNVVSVKTTFSPFVPDRSPSVTITFDRRLFPRRQTRGVFQLHIAREPQLAFDVLFPSPFGVDTSSIAGENGPGSKPPSISGFARGKFLRSIGIAFDTFLPKFVAGMGVVLTELALEVKFTFELGFEGLSLVFSGSWSNDSAEITAQTVLTPMAVFLQLEFAYLEQRLSLPIRLSQHHSPFIALWTVVLPSTAIAIGYHFILKPRRRAARLAHIRAARRAHDEDSGAQREIDAVTGILRGVAKRHMQSETAKGGLIILEAIYRPIEKDDRVSDLAQDVTIPVQALVRNSQLHIPGDQLKSSLPGFSNPAPFTPKVLCIRYLFNGRKHYTEIADGKSAVLPLTAELSREHWAVHDTYRYK